jgi:hypothetical protein
MKLDYKQNNILSYNKFIELYEQNESALKNIKKTPEQLDIVRQIEVINKKINSAECTGCARNKYQNDIERLNLSLNTDSVEVEQYKKDKKIILSYLEKHGLLEELSKIKDIDSKSNPPIVKKAVVKKVAKKKVENATKSK